MDKQLPTKITLFFLMAYAVLVSAYVIAGITEDFSVFNVPEITNPIISSNAKSGKMAVFKSSQDFKNYLAKASANGNLSQGSGIRSSAPMMKSLSESAMPSAMGDMANIPADRVSVTNVQVAGIDEPDLVKTDGTDIYVSNDNYYFYPEMMIKEEGALRIEKGANPPVGEDTSVGTEPMQKIAPSAGIMDRYIAPPVRQNETEIIKALPADSMKKIGKIDKNGTMLLNDKVLVIFSNRNIYGFDISSSTAPKEIWNMELKSNSYVAGARQYGDKIYLVLKNSINYYRPCPLEPLAVQGKNISITCGEIYHPSAYVPIDITYSAFAIDFKSGQIKKTVSFVGAEDSSVMHMSKESIYLTYAVPGDLIKFLVGFLKTNSGLMPANVVNKLEKLDGYDLSYNTKTIEMSVIIEQYKSSLDDDDRLKFENEMSNKVGDYLVEHKRDLEKTGIVKIGIDNFKVDATGFIPGLVLNQFSLDEYEGNLRAAATIGQFGFWALGFNGGSQSVNDVYVLDKNMAIAGSVKDLGKGETIYSVRFINNKGYVVTFKQTDPFYVLDLSNPKNPAMKGELKIPGYSSYLHPLETNTILGVGQESGKVKLSMFNVTDPSQPAEIAKYSLDEYWTEAANNHHAFLQDEKHKVFFIPGGKGGYVFSYADGKLELKKAVADIIAKRALYINDNLYIIGADKIAVLDEGSWEKVGEIVIR